jgi:lambda repressor-like predicted transcriptional regulator
MVKPRKMTDEERADHERVVAWIKSNLERLGISASELARRAGIGQSNLAHSLGKARRRLSLTEIKKFEDIFASEFSYHKGQAYPIAPRFKSDKVVLFGGTISARFRGGAAQEIHKTVKIQRVMLPRYIDEPQEAFYIEDDSADLYIQPGNFATVVPYWKNRKNLQIGDKVVVKMYHPILFREGDKSVFSRTIRMVFRGDAGPVLKSLSSNPEIKDLVYDPEDGSVEIEALVIGKQLYEDY